ncbi:hypothetical protein PR202_gb15814 [Eleusine coracana subsp. coracana]|uniref:Uncharacterized protein n=1 Tax=Eleusine coracana subsp. coracana TaxID=191504 RepID=A0AAV5F045_ELECO|nr:hypothetical protein PR202_gb15814 [Eleusine coracana subsp. coracana]
MDAYGKLENCAGDSDSPGGACKGYIFAMKVTEELDQWPEQDIHGRQWQVSLADAYLLCRYEWIREALSAILDRLPAICHCQHQMATKPAAPELNERLPDRRLCRYEWMREALSVLLDRLPAICHCQHQAATKPAAPELNERAGMYMMIKAAANAEPLLIKCYYTSD